MKKILLLLAWIPTTLMSLLISFYLLHSYTHIKGANTFLVRQAAALSEQNGYQFYASLPEVLGSFSAVVTTGDARPEILKQFLNKHASPLEPYADYIVSVSDRESIDFRLITAIAMCESNLGKKIPANSYNAWGYAIYTGQASGAAFTNWKDAIETMAGYLATKFYSQSLTSPEEIGPIYAPPSIETDNSWAKCVRTFMDQLI